MNAERPEKVAATNDVTAEFEGEIRELIRSRDVTFLRAPGKAAGDFNNLTSLIQRVAGGSVAEIDALIEQLQEMRDYLHDEAERVRTEISNYAKASQAAREHVELLTDRISNWRSGYEAPPVAVTHD